MRLDELKHQGLLRLDPEGGLIHFAGRPALVVDAIAMGLHRKYLVENFGNTAARAILTQFGFAQGWLLAAAMREEFEWDEDEDDRLTGYRILCQEGRFRAQSGSEDPLGEKGAVLLSSYEAEQHLLHLGRSDSSGCWTLSGLISGYFSNMTGKEIFVLEDRCMCRGDSACHMEGRSREEWGDERASDFAFFKNRLLKESLDVSLAHIVEALQHAEATLESHRKVLELFVPEEVEPLGIIAKSPAMKNVVALARRTAAVDVTVLISGESGVGKERIARLIHDESPRVNGPFIAINCGAISESLVESELFGHKRGSFTGAESDRVGLFEAANHGTILLDEIGELSPAMQIKLLRVLQEREVRRVGENRSRPFDVRVLAATNRSLAEDIEDGSFRQDLYYRLCVVELKVPPLRERNEDILPLARVLLASAALRMSRDVKLFSSAVADQLHRYHWPGNVRELENAMERAMALAQGDRVELEDLAEEPRVAPRRPLTNGAKILPLNEAEREYIQSVLKLNDGNRIKTAEQLEIGSSTLYRKLKSYG